MKVTFWGAARTVTGSMHHLEIQGKNYLLDCGQYQGRRHEAEQRNRHLPFDAASISAVLLSHAHMDHSGNLPLLAKSGFDGPIYSSPATADLCRPMLLDSANLQQKDAEYIRKRNARLKRLGVPLNHALAEPVEPMYNAADTAKALAQFRTVPMHHPTPIGGGLTYTSYEAGHMLGSTCMLLECEEGGRKVRLGFSGDVGRPGLPIIRDPEPFPEVDFLILESTYGGRYHAPAAAAAGKLAEVVNSTFARKGKIVVPAFAVGRTQQLVLMLHQLINERRIPSFPIFVDSPLAVNVTEVFRKHTELFDEETRDFLAGGEDPFGFRRLTYVRDVESSKALNDLAGPYLVISASGMCEAGRVLHHLKNNVGDSRNTVLLAGYQAVNTLGRKLEDRLDEVPIFGQPYRVRARVEKLDELSGHADQKELLDWVVPATRTLKRIFLVHGEGDGQTLLASALRERFGMEVIVPARGQSFEL
jgi:metallo-beta-lactamase family protein